MFWSAGNLTSTDTSMLHKNMYFSYKNHIKTDRTLKPKLFNVILNYLGKNKLLYAIYSETKDNTDGKIGGYINEYDFKNL